jgi:hypothetical protein
MDRDDLCFMAHLTMNGTVWDPNGSTGPCIDVLCGDSCLIDGSSLNKCIQTITNGQARHRWSGPLLVMKQQDEYGRSQRYVDVDQQTLNAAVFYFTNYPSY